MAFSQQMVIEVAKLLKEGKVILYPTDTIWGIGCDATNEKAVEKIYQIKQRALSKAMIVLIDSENKLPDYVTNVPEIAWDIVPFAESPLTVIYNKAKNLATNLYAEDGSIAIRVVQDDFCKALIYRLGKPIVSTSANISGEASPQSFDQIDELIKKQVDYIVDYRKEEKNGKASKIIRLGEGGEFELIRA